MLTDVFLMTIANLNPITQTPHAQGERDRQTENKQTYRHRDRNKTKTKTKRDLSEFPLVCWTL